ncbi:MAG: sugar phosphate isomerase/epimerase [Chloroflexi bacterium]|nr:sugar phosphate isomerase/epimerase [Chloroflexota bacterium]
MTMSLSYSTWSTQKLPIDAIVAHCAKLGFDGLELTVIPGWTTDAATLTPAERRRIRALYDEHNLELCGITGNTPLLATDPAEHAANMARYKSYLDLTAELQRPGEHLAISTTSSGRKDQWEEVKDRLVDVFGELAAHAEQRGVIVGMEPHVGAALHLPDQVLWLLAQVNSPGLRVHFDISHFNVQGLDMEAVIAQIAPHSVHPPGKDERGVEPDYAFLIPGEGECDYVRYLRAMERAGYTGHITVEISMMVQRRPDYDAYAAADQSYRILSKAFEDAGIQRP